MPAKEYYCVRPHPRKIERKKKDDNRACGYKNKKKEARLNSHYPNWQKHGEYSEIS
jgi:hypothetical protein